MNPSARTILAPRGSVLGWLFEPLSAVGDEDRSFLLGQLLGSPLAVLMGSFSAQIVAVAALMKSNAGIYGILIALELAVMTGRLVEWRWRSRRLAGNPQYVPSIDGSVVLSTAWCTLQGFTTFTILSSGDLVLSVISAMLVMALTAPICARSYAAPRFAFMLVLLCDLPFIIGALISGERWLIVLVPMTPPFMFGAMLVIVTFHRSMLARLSAQASLRHLAEHDSLTGVLNRQGMDQALSRISPDQNRHMALLIVDLDGFKQVNDRHGHGAGDILLILVAARLRRELRSHDLLGRMGGDEFMIVVRDMTPDEALPLAGRLIAAIADQPYEAGEGVTARVGASIGFACLPEDATTTLELRLRADQALYVAKASGKGVGRRFYPPVAAAVEYSVVTPIAITV